MASEQSFPASDPPSSDSSATLATPASEQPGAETPSVDRARSPIGEEGKEEVGRVSGADVRSRAASTLQRERKRGSKRWENHAGGRLCLLAH